MLTIFASSFLVRLIFNKMEEVKMIIKVVMTYIIVMGNIILSRIILIDCKIENHFTLAYIIKRKFN